MLVTCTNRSVTEAALKPPFENAIREPGREGQSLNPEDPPDYVPLHGARDEPHEGNAATHDIGIMGSNADGAQISTRSAELALPEHSHAGESHSNGASGSTVQLIEDQART